MENNGDSGNSLEVVPKKGQLSEWYFPFTLLMEIIRRLPFKSILKSKGVCMELCSLISDDTFARFYMSALSPLLQDSFWAKIYVPRLSLGMKSVPFAFVTSLMYVDNERTRGCGPLYFDALDAEAFSGNTHNMDVYSLALPAAHQKEEKRKKGTIFGYDNILCMYEIVAVDLDLVLYATNKTCVQFYICNPFTGQWIELPPASRPFPWMSCGFVTRVEDGTLMGYSVVRFNCPLETSILSFEVFTSEIGEWRSYDMFIGQTIELSPPRRPTSFNGSLHWLVYEGSGILAYDPVNNPRGYGVIPLPADCNEISDVQYPNGNFNIIVAHRGCLKYLEVTEAFDLANESRQVISVWKLNDYYNLEWSLMHKVQSRDILPDGLSSFNPFCAIPVNFDPFDEDVLYLGCLNCVVSYNFQTRKLKAHGALQLPDCLGQYYGSRLSINFPPWRFVFVLVPIPTPTLIPLPSPTTDEVAT